MGALARQAGLSPGRILLEEEAASTLESALHCRSLLLKIGHRELILVTDGYHLLRSIFVFRAAGFEASGSPVPGGNHGTAAWKRGFYVLREAAALAWYLLRMQRDGSFGEAGEGS
jgi:uncharacterized SAM-binding protein YcdF (DUF218 family)